MSNILQTQISLKVPPHPEVQRVILIPEETNLFELHCIIQLAFGWTNSHSHEFREPGRNGKVFGNLLGMEEGDMPVVQDSRKTMITDVLNKKTPLLYIYDMGDSWEHVITLEDEIEETEQFRFPVVLSGQRKCPPEDCGSIGGYDDLVKAMKKGKGEEYQEFKEWLGCKYDPEHFDLEKTNTVVKKWKVCAKQWEKHTFTM